MPCSSYLGLGLSVRNHLSFHSLISELSYNYQLVTNFAFRPYTLMSQRNKVACYIQN